MAEVEVNPGAASGGSDVPNLGTNPIVKQLGAMVGIAISVALGVAVIMWTQTPNYSVLDGSLSEKDSMEVIDALSQSDIEYMIDPSTGSVLVESGKLQRAKMKIAALGLPRNSALGFELMTQDPGFGVSQLVEKARHKRAIEGELARSISNINSVKSARVHLALPKQSVFVRKRKMPSASVILKLYSGRKLQEGQVDAIVHMVASSIPELESEHVTVIDQKGHLLSSGQSSSAMQLSATQFEYTNKIEDRFRDRIYDILVPILGDSNVRVQVNADIDFTVTERTRESFNPDLPALRSEQVNEESSRVAGAGGVPGALSNQPAAAGNAPEIAGDGGTGGASGGPGSSSKQATRNYELDKTISHTRLSPTTIKRVSVAIVIDDLVTTDGDGTIQRVERTPEEIARISQLAKEAIGYNGVRGDTVKVINSSFIVPEVIEDLPEIPMWEQAWFFDAVKQGGGLLIVLLLIFVILKPAMKRLTSNEVAMIEGGMAAGGAAGGAAGAAASGVDSEGFSMGVDESGQPIRLPGPGNYESVLEAARRMVDEDPKRVAQLVKTWTS